MKSLTVSEKLWHYKLAKFGGLSTWGGETDICAYTRHCVFGLLYICLCGIGTLIATELLVETLFSIIFSLIYSMDLFTEIGKAGIIIIVVSTVMGLILYLIGKFAKWSVDRKYRILDLPKKPDGFLKEAYNSYKHKYCLKINIEES